MRRILLAFVVIGLAGPGLLCAQDSEVDEPVPEPEMVPVQAKQVKEPVPLPGPFAPPVVGPAPLAPTAAPPPPVLADPALDAFTNRFWVGVDYLLWWTKGDRLPPLVTSGSPTDFLPGALGQPGTQTLFGGDQNSRVRSGVRVRGGYWFNPEQTFGLDGTFFFLGGQTADFGDSSNGIPVLARPFYNANTGNEDAFIVAYPGRQRGEVFGALSTRLWGADADLRGMLFRGACYQVNLLGGFRFLDLHDSLAIKENNAYFPQSPFGPLFWSTSIDHFNTSNQFYGGQLGTDMMWSRGRFFIDVLAKVALGVSVERAGIDGWTAYNTRGGSGTFNVGELALPSNIGSYGQDHFAVVPEFGINFGYAITRHIRLTFGYTLLYWSNVFRVGDQIDRAINPTELVALADPGAPFGPARPSFTFRSSNFWAQGLNFGLQFRY